MLLQSKSSPVQKFENDAVFSYHQQDMHYIFQRDDRQYLWAYSQAEDWLPKDPSTLPKDMGGRDTGDTIV